MIVKNDLKEILSKAFKDAGYGFVEDVEVKFSSLENTHFQCNNCFKVAKIKGINPLEVAKNVVDKIAGDERFEFEIASPAYVNIRLTGKGFSYYAEIINAKKDLGVEKTKNPKKILMDYGGANVAKALHMGHLRSPIIGESLKRLLRLKGNEVISDVHYGDFGLQMGLTLAQLEEDGYLEYFFGRTEEKPNITLDLLNEEYPKASGRKKDEVFKAKADEITLLIQGKKEPYFSAYLFIRDVSVKEINKYYSLLNADFDLLQGESDVAEIIDEVVQIFVDKGIAYESNGALVCDVALEGEHIPIPKTSEDEVQRYKNPMPPVLLKKWNGGDLYATTDIATVFKRNKEYAPDAIIYVADFRQSQHFTQFFRACKKAGISPESQELIYLPFGTMNGKDGKPFKTRSGDTIKLEDIYSLVVNKAKEKLAQNGIVNDEELARQIGVSALKFGDLSNTISKDYVCDIDKFASFEGKTGPYIQYNGARIKSILRKAEISESELNSFDIKEREEKNVLMAIFKLIESYDLAIIDLSLNGICTALFELANSFSQLYNNINILKEEDLKRRSNLLSLCHLTLKALTQALFVLGIDMPEKM